MVKEALGWNDESRPQARPGGGWGNRGWRLRQLGHGFGGEAESTRGSKSELGQGHL